MSKQRYWRAFWQGVGSILNLCPALPKRFSIQVLTDAEAFDSDQQAVADDMWRAFETLTSEERQAAYWEQFDPDPEQYRSEADEEPF